MQFRTDIESHLRSLEALGCDVQGPSWIVVTLLAEKLTPRTLELVNRKAGTDYPSVNQFREALGLAISQLVELDRVKSIKDKDKGFKLKVKPYSPVNWDKKMVGQYSGSTEGDGEKPSPAVTQAAGMPVPESTALVAQTLASSPKYRKNRVAVFVMERTFPLAVTCEHYRSVQKWKTRRAELG